MNTADRFRVMTASAKMPARCWGRYARVAVVEVDPAALALLGRSSPAMISRRARGLVRIVRTWEKRNVGGPRSAFHLALAEAKREAALLNAA